MDRFAYDVRGVFRRCAKETDLRMYMAAASFELRCFPWNRREAVERRSRGQWAWGRGGVGDQRFITQSEFDEVIKTRAFLSTQN